jgi:hypothetical protein
VLEARLVKGSGSVGEVVGLREGEGGRKELVEEGVVGMRGVEGVGLYDA